MINEKKVILMTKLASFEAGEGKKLLPTMTYFRSDYIGSQMLKSFIAGTVSLICIVAVYLFYNFEVIMADIYNIDYIATLKRAGIVYAVLMVKNYLQSSMGLYLGTSIFITSQASR